MRFDGRFSKFKTTTQSYILLQFVSFLFLNFKCANALRCLNCRTIEQQLVCDSHCDGDFCVLWAYREMSDNHLVQGCVTGLDLKNTRLGCRTNRAEAKLCLCNSGDFCNEEGAAVSRGEVQPMPTGTRCISLTEAPFLRRNPSSVAGQKQLSHFCPSDYCFFTQTNVTNISGENELLTSRNCGHMPQYNFDLLIGALWPGQGMLAEACYLLQAQRQDTMLGCSCSHNDCNREVPYPILREPSKEVRCHMAYGTISEDQLDSNEFCRGHFCLLQKTEVPNYGVQWLKGCISANESAAVDKLKIGYRNILGIEQWLCSVDFCNFDLASVSLREPRQESVRMFASDSSLLSAEKQRHQRTSISSENSSGIAGRARAQVTNANMIQPNFSTKLHLPSFWINFTWTYIILIIIIYP